MSLRELLQRHAEILEVINCGGGINVLDRLSKSGDAREAEGCANSVGFEAGMASNSGGLQGSARREMMHEPPRCVETTHEWLQVAANR